jgi:hypothetical protein
MALLLPAALIYQDVLFEEIPNPIIYAGGLGIVVTCIFIWACRKEGTGQFCD